MDASKNKVELIGHYGGDRAHAMSAWTSTTRAREATDEDVARVIQQMADNGHGTPFEKSMLHFFVTSDIASHIHLLKHRIGVSINTESARYRELSDNYYIPEDWPIEERIRLDDLLRHVYREYHSCMKRLVQKGLSKKRAKETARFYLPYANQVKQDVSFNFRSFLHFYNLRADKHAQREIAFIAEEMLRLIEETGAFDMSLRAHGLHSTQADG